MRNSTHIARIMKACGISIEQLLTSKTQSNFKKRRRLANLFLLDRGVHQA
ncbi:MAG: hypothetical protein ACL7BU_04705 [Candidatus Phlomobacter fragariae]